MFEKEAKEYVNEEYDFCYYPEGNLSTRINAERDWQNGAEFGYNKAKEDADKMKSQFLELCNLKDMRIAESNKANEWHYPSKGELPKVHQECYFIHSNTYGQIGNKPIFTKSTIQVHAGVYTNAYDEEGNETTDFCFYDDFIDEEMDINEVYAWKEIVLPELPKELENDN